MRAALKNPILEWEDERPLAPSYLRVLYLGKMLQDDDTLTSAFPTPFARRPPAPFRRPPFLGDLHNSGFLCSQTISTELKFPTHIPQSTPAPTPTIVHLSIRPVPPAGEGDLKKKRGRGRSGDSEFHAIATLN